MTPADRELLVLAARAANLGPLDFDYAESEGHGLFFGPRLPLPQGVLMAANYTYWRPLEDDADALRLAVKLRMHIRSPLIDTAYAVCWRNKKFESSVVSNGDHFAATRRAIVRAAAAIGETL